LLYGVSDSLSPAIGYNWGAQNYDRVKRIVRCGYVGTGVIGLLSTAFLFFCPELVAAFFVNASDEMLLAESARAIRLFCITYLFRWFAVTTQGFLSAIEKPVQATVVSVSTALVFPVIVLVALWFLGLDGIWLNFTVVNFLSALLSLVLLWRVLREIRKKA